MRFNSIILLFPFICFKTLASSKKGGPPTEIHLKAYYSIQNCVALDDDDTIKKDSLDLFTYSSGPEKIDTKELLNSSEMEKKFELSGGFDGVIKNKELWRSLRCYWALRDELPQRILALPERDGFGISVKDLPKSAIKIGNPSRSIAENEIQNYLKILNSKDFDHCQGTKRLYVGRLFGPSGGHEIAEIFVGVPEYAKGMNKNKISKIKYCRFTIHNKINVLSIENGNRASGVEEHVDSEPPELSDSNWFDTSISTLGYLSLDQGKSWTILTADGGFEGIGFEIGPVGKNNFIYYRYHPISH